MAENPTPRTSTPVVVLQLIVGFLLALGVSFAIGGLVAGHFAKDVVTTTTPVAGAPVAVIQPDSVGAINPDTLTVVPIDPALIHEVTPPSDGFSHVPVPASRTTVAPLPTTEPTPAPSVAATPGAVPTGSPIPGAPTATPGTETAIYHDDHSPNPTPIQFLDPCAGGGAHCPPGVGGTIRLGDPLNPLAQPLRIDDARAPGGFPPSAESIVCLAVPASADHLVYAIVSNNPGHFIASDSVSHVAIAQATTDQAQRTRWAADIANHRTAVTVTCMSIPVTTSRTIIITGVDDNGSVATIMRDIGPVVTGNRPPVGITGVGTRVFNVDVATRLHAGEYAAVTVVLHHEGIATSCSPTFPAPLSTDATVYYRGTQPINFGASIYPYSHDWEQVQTFTVNLNRGSPHYDVCVQWYIQEHSYDTPRLEDAQSILLIPAPQIDTAVTIAGISEIEPGTSPPHIDPTQLHVTLLPAPSAGPCTFTGTAATPLVISGNGHEYPVCTLHRGELGSRVAFASVTFNGHTLTSAIWLPDYLCNPGTGMRTGCQPDDAWDSVPMPNADNAPFANLTIHLHSSYPGYAAGVVPGVYNSWTTGARIPVPGLPSTAPPTPGPAQISPLLDTFNTSITPDPANPSHGLILHWAADRPVRPAVLGDGHNTWTCSAEGYVASGIRDDPTLSGSIQFSHLCAGTTYFFGLRITDAAGNSTTYSPHSPTYTNTAIDFSGTTALQHVKARISLAMQTPPEDHGQPFAVLWEQASLPGLRVGGYHGQYRSNGQPEHVHEYRYLLCVDSSSPTGLTYTNDVDTLWPQDVRARVQTDFIFQVSSCTNDAIIPGISIIPDSDIIHQDAYMVIVDPVRNNAGPAAPQPALPGGSVPRLTMVIANANVP